MIEEKMIQTLIQHASEVRLNARVPHSGFKVGAAILADDGKIYTGCNLEIGTMEFSICAERAALANAVSAGQQQYRAIAVIADMEEPVSPCGLCRQNLIDFGLGWDVIMATTRNDEVRIVKTIDLLPYAFTGSGRKKAGA
jgi:cytidine deaminase